MKKGLGVVLLIISFSMIGLGTYYLFKDKEFTVEFIGIDNPYKVKVKNNSYIKRPQDPIKINYIFDGWYIDGKKFSFSSKITNNIKLEAKWIIDSNQLNDEEKDEFNVKFQDDEGKLISYVIVKKGMTVEKPIDPIKEGYKFIGWYKDMEIYDFNFEVTVDMVLTAKFEKSSDYIVSFNTNGGNNIASISVESGKSVSKPKDPIKNGYKFISWQLDGKDYNFNNKVEKNITLTAKWEKIVTYTVKFNTNGGNSIGSILVEKDSKISKPKDPAKNGYRFVSWQLDGKDYDFNSKVTKDITLSAKWEVIYYTISFNTNGGSSIDSIKVISGNQVTKPDNPTKEGYEFVKWQLNGNDIDFPITVTKDITLVAVWEEEK